MQFESVKDNVKALLLEGFASLGNDHFVRKYRERFNLVLVLEIIGYFCWIYKRSCSHKNEKEMKN